SLLRVVRDAAEIVNVGEQGQITVWIPMAWRARVSNGDSGTARGRFLNTVPSRIREMHLQ
ncbi:MAG: hypothetical protein AAGG44_20120, partial [Planctomycetota bacterium]